MPVTPPRVPVQRTFPGFEGFPPPAPPSRPVKVAPPRLPPGPGLFDALERVAPRPGGANLKWGNPTSKPTYGHTFLDHSQKVKDTKLIDRARTKDLTHPASAPNQIGAWNNDQAAADLIAEAVRGRKPGEVFDIDIPAAMGRSFTADGTKLTVDKARIVVGEDGSITTSFPFSSTGK